MIASDAPPGSPQPVAILIRSMAGIAADAAVEERHSDELVITDHPVEQGSTISDHAYKMPAELILTYVWAMGGTQNFDRDPTFLAMLYQKLLKLQVDREIFIVYTGKRSYQNMLLQSLQVTTDEKTENVLFVRAVCREVLMATTRTVRFTDSSVQLMPSKTAPVVNQGNMNLRPAPNWRP
jgi:hypothetical protein